MTKFLELSRVLEARIRSGEWADGRIPTVRDLAEQHRVSAFTASRALHVLRSKGLIQTVERSGCYRSPGVPAAPAKESWGLLLRVSPGTWSPASASVVQAGFDNLAAREGISFEPAPFDLGGGEGPDPKDAGPANQAELCRQARACREKGLAGIFFLPSRVSDRLREQDELFLSACRAEGLAVVLLDRNLRGAGRPLACDLVCSDHFDGGLHCTRHLLGLGRRRVACIVASPTSSHVDRVSGYLYALHEAGPDLAPVVLELTDEIGQEPYSWLADQLREHGCDGVLCYQDYTALGLILELLMRGVVVPRDVAVVGCDDLPVGRDFSLGITTYAYPAEEIARQALRVMRERVRRPDAPPVRVVVPGRLVVRNSTVPAEQRQREGEKES
jgi:LacI family transcriptional regulator